MEGKDPTISVKLLDMLVKYGVVNEDDVTAPAEQVVHPTLIWELLQILENKIEIGSKNQTAEMSEVQKYVEHVRMLSEERDKLTMQFDQENEKLRLQLQGILSKSELEKSEIEDMCMQEGLEELVGSTFSEQMAYLLVVRATLLDKLEALQEKLDESVNQHSEISQQVKSLTSEDSELRERMTSAMSEMGGMASKLTEAICERDNLKKEVKQLTEALDGISSLPSVTMAKAEAATHLRDLESQREFYQSETEKLRDELKSARENTEIVKDDLSTEIEDLIAENKKLQESNKRLSDQLGSGMYDTIQINTQQNDRQKQSKKIIEEMKNALEEDEAKANEEILRLNQEKEELQHKLERLETHADSSFEAELRAQLVEAKLQYDGLRLELESCQDKLTSAERKLSSHYIAGDNRKEQLDMQIDITHQLQERNATLEVELAKVLQQLKVGLDKLSKSDQEVAKLKLQLNNPEHDVARLQRKIDELEDRLFSETSGTNGNNQLVSHLQKQLDQESQIRIKLEKQLETAGDSGIMELQQRALNAEAQLLLIKGEEIEQDTEKLVADLNRDQLEDAVDLMRRRLEICSNQTRSYSDKYKNLKQKHRNKIRRIRELFLMERQAMAEEVERLERRLALATNVLGQELSWKEKAAADVRAAEREKRSAINRADQYNKKVDESVSRINHLESLNEDLGAENGLLHQQLALLEKQKVELEYIVELSKRKKQKEELNTLLSSLSLSGSLPNITQVYLTQASGKDDDINLCNSSYLHLPLNESTN